MNFYIFFGNYCNHIPLTLTTLCLICNLLTISAGWNWNSFNFLDGRSPPLESDDSGNEFLSHQNQYLNLDSNNNEKWKPPQQPKPKPTRDNSLIANLIRFRNQFTKPPPKIGLIGQTWENVPTDQGVKSPVVQHNEGQEFISPVSSDSEVPTLTCDNSPDVANIGLEMHNVLRQRHNTESLELSRELSQRAQACAAYYCDRPESAFHTCPFRAEINAGENIYQIGTLDTTGEETVQNGVLHWYNEIRFYNFANPLCSPLNPSSLHFTQMMWRSVRQVGIGLCSCFRSQNHSNSYNSYYNNDNIDNINNSNKTVFVALYNTLQRNGSARRRCASVIQNVLPPNGL